LIKITELVKNKMFSLKILILSMESMPRGGIVKSGKNKNKIIVIDFLK